MPEYACFPGAGAGSKEGASLATSGRKLSGAARVLVVADPPLSDVVRLTLNHGVYAVESTATLAEATALERDFKPHLLILDIDLKAADATALLGKIVGGRPLPTLRLLVILA